MPRQGGLPTYSLPVSQAEAAAKARDWTLGMVAYDRVLSGLSEVTSQHAAGRDDDSDSSDGEDAEQPAEAAAAAAAPSSKAARAAKKVAKTEVRLGCCLGVLCGQLLAASVCPPCRSMDRRSLSCHLPCRAC